MNLDEIFKLDASMPLVYTDPLLLLSCILAAVGAGWFCAWRYRNTYEIKKSLKLYLPFALVLAVVYTLLGIPLLFAVGAQLCGGVALVLIFGRYFDGA